MARFPVKGQREASETLQNEKLQIRDVFDTFLQRLEWIRYIFCEDEGDANTVRARKSHTIESDYCLHPSCHQRHFTPTTKHGRFPLLQARY